MSWLTRRRIAWFAGGLVAFLILAGVTAVIVLQSDWFYNKVRLKLISAVETATGGRVEIGSFRFHWKQLRAEVHDFVVHGTEPPDKPPLFRAPSVVVGLKIISLSKRDVDIQSLDVTEPHIYLIIAPDGSTNVPEPKTKSNKSTIQSLLDAAIGHFTVERGLAEVEAHGATPFNVRGENVVVNIGYDASVPRYRGTFAAAPLHLKYAEYGPEPFDVKLAFTMERNRIALDSARLVTAKTDIEASGGIEDLNKPRAAFKYTAHASLADVARVLRLRELRQGAAVINGTGSWAPEAGLSLNGALHATGVEYRDSSVHLAGFRAEGSFSLEPKGIDVSRLAISGDYIQGKRREKVEGQIADLALRGHDIELRGVAVALLNGSFRGDVRVRNMDRFTVEGALSGLDARRAASLYTDQALPWDALVSGPVKVEGSLKHSRDLRATAALNIAPAPSGDKVSGQINAVYDARGGGNLDLGRSSISLPHSRADFSGSIGRTLTVHLETTDLNDLLPALSQSASTIPVKLNSGGRVIFDGSVTGSLSAPRIAGHLQTANITYSEESVDSLQADVQAAPDYLRLQNAAATRGALRAQFQGSVGLSDWKTTDASPISVTASISNASATDILALANQKDVPLTGTINGSASINGTIGKMRAQADITALKGAYKDEPFDSLTAHATYTDDTVELSNAQLTAGAKQVKLTATYHHTPQRFNEGRLRFQVTSNAMPVEQIQTFAVERPDVKGAVEVTANGDVELTPVAKTPYRIHDLHADVTANGIHFGGQPIGNAHLVANSQGDLLRAHLDSTVAGSTVNGDGEWRLEGEYPGKADLQFTKVDLARLKDWLAPSEEPARFAGSAEGTLHAEGPAQHWQAMRAELRIRQFQIGAAPTEGANAPAVTVHNSGDIVFRIANSVLTAESAHFVGPGTDFNVTGRVMLDQKSPLDLRADGKADLAIVHDFLPDFIASGGVALNASVRGSFSDPQLLGRMEFQKANFHITDIPNGISNADGVIVFNKDRATIQSLTGETGGGTIQLFGSAGYGGAKPTVFRLGARATEVRVRYPEGVSTVANATLILTGTSTSSVLSGNVTVLRTGINLQSDFSSILAKTAQPVQTPGGESGLLSNMSLDVQIDTSPDIQLQSTLTENVQAEANLKLRGTASHPALLGRINITQGKLNFFGTQYELNQGSISFFNPVKIDPILNIDLETKARGIDITLTIAGSLNKLTLTPRSDPPLEFNEIVALLATGRTPTSDPSLWTQQQANSQSWTQMGASALLGSAIANPVAGRLQRFFGVSKLRIDPTITGVENNPQARLTLEQQITPALTFTYIQNVTTSNPQVIRMEWAFSKQWSAVALREENGLFGLDFLYKRRFK